MNILLAYMKNYIKLLLEEKYSSTVKCYVHLSFRKQKKITELYMKNVEKNVNQLYSLLQKMAKLHTANLHTVIF